MIKIITGVQFLKNQQNISGEDDSEFLDTVKNIRTEVRRDGDLALRKFAKSLDRVEGDKFELKVTVKEIKEAYTSVSSDLIKALQKAAKNIEKFHRHQRPKSWQKTAPNGVTQGMRYTPIERVGLYVPGGRAIYPSSVLMNAIPAKIAAVPELIMATPPRPDGKIAPSILVAADIVGVEHIFKMGGAQAVFAMAYGTQSIPKVDKIVGPGNNYVTKAKQMVYGQVDIDKPAGPSEVLVVIEDAQYAAFAAVEVLAQLEHDPAAAAVVIATSTQVLEQVLLQLKTLMPQCLRQEILKKSIENAHLVVAKDIQELYLVANKIASEHVVLLSENSEKWRDNIHHAGAIFMGPYTPVTLGDYYAGPNHVLPTAGAARFSSPLNVMDFMKFTSILGYTPKALKSAAKDLGILTQEEGLDAHYLAVKLRLKAE